MNKTYEYPCSFKITNFKSKDKTEWVFKTVVIKTSKENEYKVKIIIHRDKDVIYYTNMDDSHFEKSIYLNKYNKDKNHNEANETKSYYDCNFLETLYNKSDEELKNYLLNNDFCIE